MSIFVSSTIPYVNARPHLGFAYELVLADVLARHHRRRGRAVHFVTGTDDNSIKNVVAAAREGVPVRALVDRNAAAFRALGPLLDIAADDFVRTSDDPRHPPAVERLWRACAARGDLYRKRWEGRYCVGCEAFVDDADLDDGRCREHGVAPEPIAEENWFFRLSRWRAPLRDAIASGRLAIVPDAARNETLAFLDGDVRDLSVSRDAARADGWGIPVPGDPSQVIYVWFDALVNYLTSAGDRWGDFAERVHVLGKGVTRFHAVFWPAFLLSAGLPLPTRILVHGYLTVDGLKISKTISTSGRTVEVAPIVERCGVDAVRWYLLRRCRTRTDGDVGEAAIVAAHDGDLADRLGNLAQRCLTLAARVGIGAPEDADLAAAAAALPARIDDALAAFLPDDALAAAVDVIDAANRSLDARAPWKLARAGDAGGAAAAIAGPLAALRVVAAELAPFVPRASAALLARLDAGTAGAPLFPRLRAA